MREFPAVSLKNGKVRFNR